MRTTIYEKSDWHAAPGVAETLLGAGFATVGRHGCALPMARGPLACDGGP